MLFLSGKNIIRFNIHFVEEEINYILKNFFKGARLGFSFRIFLYGTCYDHLHKDEIRKEKKNLGKWISPVRHFLWLKRITLS